MCRNEVAVYILGLEVLLSANFCPMFIAFLQPEIQSGIDQSLQPLPTNVKYLEPINP